MLEDINCTFNIWTERYKVFSLMYADDIILLSTSAKGLQRKLDKLNDYCKDWCLNTNTSKTKIMVFNKAGRHLKLDFKFNDVKLEYASSLILKKSVLPRSNLTHVSLELYILFTTL
jgi:hypothetical protein